MFFAFSLLRAGSNTNEYNPYISVLTIKYEPICNRFLCFFDAGKNIRGCCHGLDSLVTSLYAFALLFEILPWEVYVLRAGS